MTGDPCELLAWMIHETVEAAETRRASTNWGRRTDAGAAEELDPKRQVEELSERDESVTEDRDRRVEDDPLAYGVTWSCHDCAARTAVPDACRSWQMTRRSGGCFRHVSWNKFVIGFEDFAMKMR